MFDVLHSITIRVYSSTLISFEASTIASTYNCDDLELRVLLRTRVRTCSRTSKERGDTRPLTAPSAVSWEY